ncbi:DsbA family protein [Halomarina litorea]|uniref:DsbA family protein n=1 Tax=Halomarina litorea TaxID=2961595 RepID=UPI0020C35EBF|nr:thioredoxin domain-containing protein [Halomarina sp. BCD28]
MTLSRRRLLLAGGSAAAVGLSGCLGLGGDAPDDPNETSGSNGTDAGGNGSASTTTPAEVDGPIANAPVPNDPGEFTYARMGSGDLPTFTYFGNWKCPFCARFSVDILGDLVTQYVASGRLDMEYRGLAYVNGEPFLGPDAPRATRAGLAVWAVDPERYWPYHEYVMANQPSEAREWATADRLVEFARAAGVSDPEAVRERLDDEAFERAVEETSARASELELRGTPSLLVDGTVVSPFARESGDIVANPEMYELLDSLAEG